MNQLRSVRVCNIDEEGRFGGPERRIVLVSEGLQSHAIDTLILIPRKDSGQFEAEILRRRLRYRKIAFGRLTLEPKHLLRYTLLFPVDLLNTCVVLRKEKTEIVHVNGSYQFRSAIAAFLAGKKLVWHVNDASMHWLVRAVFTVLAPKLADAFIFSSEVAERYYFPHGFDRVKIRHATIAPPVQVDRFLPPSQARDEPRHRRGAPFTVVTVTGINPDKGVEYFIEAAAFVHNMEPSVRFRIAAAIHPSHARYFAALQRRVAELQLPEEVIEFAGFVDDIPAFLSTGDIFLYTSNTEAGPAAVWEAMACGLPVVTTNVGAVPEYLENGVDAMIVPPRASRQMADNILQLIRDPALRKALGHAAREKVVKRLSVDSAASKHAHLYREILANA